MVVNGLDLNYLGVSNVWNNEIGLFLYFVMKSFSKLMLEQAMAWNNVVSAPRKMMLKQLPMQWQFWQSS